MGAARTLFGKGPLYYDSAGYLAHLAIERLLKIMLPWGADLPLRMPSKQREALMAYEGW